MASVFTLIIEGKIPGHFIWQDEKSVAIMTIQPLRQGHVLVIPREEIDHWDDLPAELAGHLMLVAQQVAKALKQTFPCKRVGLVIAGLEVPHTHVHVFPVDELGDFDFARVTNAETDALADAAQRIRSSLTSLGIAHGCD